MLAQRTISSPNNQDVVITIIDNTLDKFELFGVRCRKKFHSCRNAVQTHDCLHHLRTFFFQVCICWTYYYLVSFIHIIHFLKNHCFNPSKTAFSCSITLSNSSPSHNAQRPELWTCLTCGANVQIIIENGWRNPIKKNRLSPWLYKKKSLFLWWYFLHPLSAPKSRKTPMNKGFWRYSKNYEFAFKTTIFVPSLIGF